MLQKYKVGIRPRMMIMNIVEILLSVFQFRSQSMKVLVNPVENPHSTTPHVK